ncbi:Crp/Fnr family transcriptional regulator [Mucilaginibacter sp. BJC16-A38]|uniref:Crp/Fnr family transcriptional regulator n=1 Tax=Mucilaginibacter phenanthrenivorans TaxID=1234842 RepID=UPI002158884F|nr:Crp/Fnr family transcriptional regulator [Mucilaginibacter phenanthrenivorans]MCR8558383.1 Crp/Fnr family transcriptional regulator [Mucilaginibacter phenanthrenivorans]
MNSLVAYLKLLKHISTEDEQIITSHFELKHFKEGDYLFKGDGRVSREMFFVCKGVIRIVSVNDKGIELTHFFYNENKFCSILQSFNDEAPTPAAIQASCDAEILVISKSRLMDLYHQLPYMKEIIDNLNQLHLIEKVNVRNTYLGEDAENQYKLFIMQHPDIAMRVPLKDIASYLGITPQSLSRIRKNLN